MRATRVDAGIPELLASYNIAPTTFQPVIRHTREGAERELLLMRWCLVPFFAKSLADFRGFSTFNAKAESIANPPRGANRFTAAAAAWCRPMASTSGRCSIPKPRSPTNSPMRSPSASSRHSPSLAFGMHGTTR